MIDPDEVRYTTTEQLTEGATFAQPTRVIHTHFGPVCAHCNRVNSIQFCGRDGILRCQHCAGKSGWMAGPRESGFLWSTWPILDNERQG